MSAGKSSNDDEKYKKLEKAVDLHQNAVDDLVSMNSVYTAAIFVGLTFENFERRSIDGNKHCQAGVVVARRLVKYEVISFACFLLSSLVAKALKTHLFTYLITRPKSESITNWSNKTLRGSLFALSSLTSILGGVFLTLSMIDIIQLLLGKLACRSTETLQAVGVLIAVNTLALVIYALVAGRAIFKSTKIFNLLEDEKDGPSKP